MYIKVELEKRKFRDSLKDWLDGVKQIQKYQGNREVHMSCSYYLRDKRITSEKIEEFENYYKKEEFELMGHIITLA